MTDGILIIDKPAGMTSHDVVARVRRILKTKRVGHTGTLDPFATGVLVLLIGKATRLAQYLDKDEKQYEAVVQFGYETDTGDLMGRKTTEAAIGEEELTKKLHCTDWDSILKAFRGVIRQTPPMYSAKKVEGKKLYELARKGVTVQREPITANISALDLYFDRNGMTTGSMARMTVTCSAGTYIRTLAEDIGRSVNTGAHLHELRRTCAGRYGIDRAVTLEELAALEQPEQAIASVEEAVEHLPKFFLNDDRVSKTRSGLATRLLDGDLPVATPVAMVDAAGSLIAIGTFDAADNYVRPKIVLV